jgi:hypothetical protein
MVGFSSKDDITSQALIKLLKLKRSLLKFISLDFKPLQLAMKINVSAPHTVAILTILKTYLK